MRLRRRAPAVTDTELDVCLWDSPPSGSTHAPRALDGTTLGELPGGDGPSSDGASVTWDLSGGPGPEDPGAGPGVARWGRGRAVRSVAFAAAGVLAAGLTVGVWAASQSLPEGQIRPLPVGGERWSRSLADFIDSRAAPITDPTGTVIGWANGSYQLWEAGSVLLVDAIWSEQLPWRDAQMHQQLYALDADTGRTLWDRDVTGMSLSTPPARVGDLLALVVPGEEESTRRVAVVGLRTGAVRGERTYAAGVQVTAAAMGCDLLVVAARASRADVARLDPATLAARWTRQVTWSEQVPEGAGHYSASSMSAFVTGLADETHAVVDHPHGAVVLSADGRTLFEVAGEAVVPLGRGYLGTSLLWPWQGTVRSGTVWRPDGRWLASVGGNLAAVQGAQSAGTLALTAGWDTEPTLVVLDTRDGQVIRRSPENATPPVAAGGTVADIAGADGLVVQGLRDGATWWSRTPEGATAPGASYHVSSVSGSSTSQAVPLYFDGSRLVHVGPAKSGERMSVISAYDMATGTPVWTVALPCGQNSQSAVVDGTLVVGGDVGLVAMG